MMMLQIKHRGTHATGVAVSQGKNSFIWKKAAPVDKVLNSDPWKAVGRQVEDTATVVQGHVRWATHANAHLDEAAHPFKEGKIVGCHNGIIRNWEAIAAKMNRKDMINDSQAPFALLNEFKNPAKALDDMDGYWALTWTKGASLFLCRTNDAVLSCAYVPSMLTLFWNSEARILRATLLEAGLKASMFDIWDVKPSTVYRYTPQTFDEKGTNADKVDAPFRGRHGGKGEKFNSAHSTITTWKDGVATTRANTTSASSNYNIPFSGGTRWDSETARETEKPRKQLSAGQITLKDLNEKFDAIIAEMSEEIDNLKGRVEVAEAETEFLRQVLDEKGLLEIEVVETDEMTVADAAEGVNSGELECDPCVNCPACTKQLGDESMFINHEVNLSDSDVGLIHTKCLFTDGHTKARKDARAESDADASGVAQG